MPLLSTIGAASSGGWKVGPPKYTLSAAQYLMVAGGTSGGAAGTEQSYSGGQGTYNYANNFSLASSGTITVGAAGSQSAIVNSSFNVATGVRYPSNNEVYNYAVMASGYGLSHTLTFTTGTSEYFGYKARWGVYTSVPAYDYWWDFYYLSIYSGNIYSTQTLPIARLSDGTQNYASYGYNGSTSFYNVVQDQGYGTRIYNYNGNQGGASYGAPNSGIGGMSSYSNNGTAGTGYSGFVEIAYPNTYALLSSTSGTVQYFNYNGKHVYRWLTSGSYSV